jgi:hypothetical protein
VVHQEGVLLVGVVECEELAIDAGLPVVGVELEPLILI